MKQDRFSPVKHVPKYSRQLYETLQTPVVVYFGLIGNIILVSSMMLFYFFEQPINPQVNSWLDAFWWGIVTVTTVGYGDIVPVTPQGRLVGLTLILMGVAFFISFTALFVSVLFKTTSEELKEGRLLTLKEREMILSRLEKMAEKIDIIEASIKPK